MRQVIRTLAATLLFAAGLCLEAQAASTLVFKVVAVQGKTGVAGRIYAGSESVMTLGGYGWKSIEAARDVAHRLNALADEGLRPDEVSIWTERRTHLLMARGERIVTVDKVVAKAQGADRASLARAWAQNLRAQFGRPYLAAAPVLVPVGETRAAPVRGNIAGDLLVAAAAPFVSATWDKSAKQVRVLGLQPGRTELILEDRENVLRVPVRAAKYAAQLVASIPAAVTGSPASPELVARAARAAVGAGLSAEPGAWISVTPSVKGTGSLWPGKSVAVPTQISAAGPEYLSYRATPAVPVRNEVVATGPANLLMVSNYPERLRSHGLWFEGKIKDSDSIRFLYHHVNATRDSADLVVELWNLGEETARVQVVAGLAGPSYDEAWVGHRAASEFLVDRAANAGWVVPAPAGAATPVVAQRMPPGSVVSGILEFRALGPANLSLRLYLAPSLSQRLPRRIESYAESPLLGQWHYPQPRREVRARYEVGRDWAFITIGDKAAPGLVAGDQLAGSYGVMYDIELDLANPTSEAARVAVLLEPAGGPARGALLVDGQPVETALLSKNAEGLVARYLLAPGETRRVHIQTLPQGGSNYPVRLVARPN